MYKYLVLFSFLFGAIDSKGQNKEEFTPQEKESVIVFESFKRHLVNSINRGTSLRDTAEMKEILLDFLFADVRFDSLDRSHIKSSEMPSERLLKFIEQYNEFYRFFAERKYDTIAEHLAIRPLRLIKDNCIYDKFIQFQKENTFVFFDERQPRNILGYMLFMPKVRNISLSPRIWSWELACKFGIWYFKSVTGEEGREYMFETIVKPPRPDKVIY